MNTPSISSFIWAVFCGDHVFHLLWLWHFHMDRLVGYAQPMWFVLTYRLSWSIRKKVTRVCACVCVYCEQEQWLWTQAVFHFQAISLFSLVPSQVPARGSDERACPRHQQQSPLTTFSWLICFLAPGKKSEPSLFSTKMQWILSLTNLRGEPTVISDRPAVFQRAREYVGFWKTA